MKPTIEDLDSYEHFEISSLIDNNNVLSNLMKFLPSFIPMIEWQKRLAMTPEDVTSKTFDVTTQYYLNFPDEKRNDPVRQYKSSFPRLRYPRLRDGVATETFFQV